MYLVLHRLVAKTSLTSPPWPEVKLPDPVEEAKYHAGKSLKSGLPALPRGLIEHKYLQLDVCVLFFFFFLMCFSVAGIVLHQNCAQTCFPGFERFGYNMISL